MASGTQQEEKAMTRRWVTLTWALIGWTGLALFLGISSSLAYLSVGNPPRWSLTIRMSLVETYVWALLAPIVMALARRFPFTRATLGTSLPAHLLAGLVISFLKLVIDQVLRQALFGFSTYLLFTSLAPNLLFYWGIVAATHSFGYYRSSKDRELRASQLEARLAQARLQVLQMQLHPHFLFNTLNTISELVHEDPETADRMIAGLSDLLREVLVSGQEPVHKVPLRRELEVLARYLEIQQARFGDRLQVEVAVDPGIGDGLVPHLLLQPIVENAIRHGLATRADAGRIHIAARRDAAMLVLTVQDDGRGLERAEDAQREGVGLGNTRARLEALYGPAHRVTIEDAPRRGVIVTVAIPFERTPDVSQ
jgi:two-component system, LytTR family, sensor kinase